MEAERLLSLAVDAAATGRYEGRTRAVTVAGGMPGAREACRAASHTSPNPWRDMP